LPDVYSTAAVQGSLVNGDFRLLCPKACNAQGHYHPDEPVLHMLMISLELDLINVAL